jgi:nucleoside-diphosphate-sugar epimerase
MSSFSGKRLVIFGCGYVGAATALDALARGARVTALTRNAAKADALRAQGIETIVADLASDRWHGQISGEPDFALNSVSSGGGGLAGYQHSYVEGAASIDAWAQRHGRIGTYVYTSSTSVYPQGAGAVLDESAPTHPAHAGERAQLLLATEDRVRASPCARWFILRLAGIYGPGRHHVIDQVRGGEVAGSGDHRLNVIHRDDIVSAIGACLAAPATVANEIFNVADDGPAHKAEIVAWLAVHLGVPSPRFTGEPASGRRALTPDRVISNAKLRATLGWVPRYPTFREGYASLW